jgi:hypothetical protein
VSFDSILTAVCSEKFSAGVWLAGSIRETGEPNWLARFLLAGVLVLVVIVALGRRPHVGVTL